MDRVVTSLTEIVISLSTWGISLHPLTDPRIISEENDSTKTTRRVKNNREKLVCETLDPILTNEGTYFIVY